MFITGNACLITPIFAFAATCHADTRFDRYISVDIDYVWELYSVLLPSVFLRVCLSGLFSPLYFCLHAYFVKL